jgi:tetratricopeptide (TPR) repeat protein
MVLGRLWQREAADQDAANLADPDPERRGQAHFRRGRLKMRKGQVEEAVTEFDQALEAVPGHADAIAARAETLDMMGRIDAARPEYARARSLWATARPGAPDRRYVFRHPGRFAFETESYDLALRRIKTGTFPHLAIGNALLAQGRAEEALKCYARALRQRPKDVNLTALKGEALLLMGNHRAALRAFTVALKANPRDLETLNSRGIVQMALGKVNAANADWRRQFELLPADQPAARACVALRMAEYRTALAELEGALARNPNDHYWNLYRLSALRRVGGPAEPAGALPMEWPRPLVDLLTGRATADEVKARADTPGRRVEAAFQLGIVALESHQPTAAHYFTEVVDKASPTLIEYAAARNELSRIAS